MKKGKKMVNDELSMMNAKANSQSTNHHSPLIKDGYKKTEIGIIPEDWEVRNLRDISIDMLQGVNTAIDIPEYVKSGIPMLKANDVIDGDINFGDVDQISCKTFRGYNIRFKPKKGDFLFSNIGARLGSGALLKENIVCSFAWNVMRIIPDKNQIIPEYLSFTINSPSFYKLVISNQTGSGMGFVPKSIIQKMSIPLPPLPEQKAIAEVLSDTDELIQTLEKQIAKKRQIKQGAMQVLLSPPATAQMLNGELSMVNEKEKWEVKKLGEIAEIRKGNTLSKSKISENGKHHCILYGELFTTYKEVINNVVSKTNFEEGIKSKYGDILFPGSTTTSGIDLAKASALLFDNVLLGGDIIIVRNQIGYNSIFLSYFLNQVCRNVIAKKTKGITIYHLYSNDLLDIEIHLPSIQEQIRIANILSDMDSEIETLENKLAKYKKIKQGMMQELLTGKIRLVNIAQINKENRVKVVPIKQKEKQKLRKDHNWQINEAVVISVLTEKFGSEDYPLGRKRYTKFSYLLHRHSEHKAEGYLKKAAGPYNPSTKYKGPESIAQKNKYIQRKKKGKLSGFVAAENIEKAQEYFKKWYGDEALEWLEQFMFETNDTLELWTTVDMAIQDLREKEKVVTVETVKSLINNHKEWKPKLKRPVFSDENIEIAINKLQSILKEH